MRNVLKSRRTSKVILVALVLASLVAPAWAGGPTQRPDGIGNPSGADYTGFVPLLIILGVQNNASVFTQIDCFNAGKGNAAVAVQAWDSFDAVNRAPVADQFFTGGLPLSDIDITTSNSWSGTPELRTYRAHQLPQVGWRETGHHLLGYAPRDRQRQHHHAARRAAVHAQAAAPARLPVVSSWNELFLNG